MSLRDFLDAAYALLVEEYQRIGVPLMEALDKTQMYQAGGKLTEEGVTPAQSAPVASSNDQAMAVLKARMTQVQGKPKLG